MTLKVTIPIQAYAKTKAELDSDNLVHVLRQEVIETDTGRRKLGNGVDVYQDLPYLSTFEAQDLEDVLTEGNNGGGSQIKNIADPTDDQDAVTKAYYEANIPATDLEAVLTEGNNGGGLQIKNIADPTDDQDAATKKYVDDGLDGKINGMGTLSDDEVAAINGANMPSSGNVFITQADQTGGLPTGQTPTGYVSNGAINQSILDGGGWVDVTGISASVILASSVPIYISSSWVADKTATGGASTIKFRVVKSDLSFISIETPQFIKGQDEPTAGSIKTRTSALAAGSHTFKLQAQFVSGGDNTIVKSAQFFVQAQQGPKGDTGAGLPVGGATGDMVRKASGVDYDFETFTPNFLEKTTTPNAINGFWSGTAAQYAAIGTPDSSIIYFVE